MSVYATFLNLDDIFTFSEVEGEPAKGSLMLSLSVIDDDDLRVNATRGLRFDAPDFTEVELHLTRAQAAEVRDWLTHWINGEAEKARWGKA